jgi:hypothetical protein
LSLVRIQPGEHYQALLELSPPPHNGALWICDVVGPGQSAPSPSVAPLVLWAGSDETVFLDREVGLKQNPYTSRRPDNGVHHADIHPKRNLPRISQEHVACYEPPRDNTMTDAAMYAIVFLGVGIFLAHAIDALRTP